MKTNFKQIKNLITKLEKKEKELASYKAKVAKLEAEVQNIQSELSTLLNGTSNEQTNSFSTYNA
jgi:cell division protein FtsB